MKNPANPQRTLADRLQGRSAADVFWLLLRRVVEALYLQWQPFWLRCATTPAYGHIRRFIREAAVYARGRRVLDAGAGSCPYRSLFSGAEYESTDLSGEHTFLCELSVIPRADNTYDMVLCSEVLEHVSEPLAVMREFYRILRPGGRMYLTVPLQARNHASPHHYCNYAEGGLRLLFQRSGFSVLGIRPTGGALHFLASNIALIPLELFRQATTRRDGFGAIGWALALMVLQPLVVAGNCLLFSLDGLDREKAITSNYLCVCEKPPR